MSALIAAATVDLLTFGIAVSVYPIAGEANPLAQALYAIGGIAAVATGKMTAILVAIGILQRLSGRRRTVGYAIAVALTAAAAASNVAAIGLHG
jgi:hypothetical protein